MEFWGVEIKPGKPLKVTPEEDCLIHISQASLGEAKKDQKGESVPLFVKIGDQKLVLGALSQENFPQITFDLVFEKEFELSHNWKNGSVYVIGYKSPNIEEGEDEEGAFYSDEDASDEEELPIAAAENGKPGPPIENEKPAKVNVGKHESKPTAKAAEPKNDAKPELDEDDESDADDESDDDEEISSEEGDMMDMDDDSEDDDDDEDEDEDSEDEDEETPKKAEQGKKRANESATKTPVPVKKAKAATPQKTDAKKGGHTATPHPAKKGSKTPANATQTPKSGSQFSCGSCKKSFSSDVGLQSHSKAKHGSK